jgi:hypothetical protein
MFYFLSSVYINLILIDDVIILLILGAVDWQIKLFVCFVVIRIPFNALFVHKKYCTRKCVFEIKEAQRNIYVVTNLDIEFILNTKSALLPPLFRFMNYSNRNKTNG